MGHLCEAYAYHFSHAELPTRGFPFKKCLRGCLRGSCCKNNLKMMVLKTRNETCHRRRAMQFLDAFFPTCQVSEGCCLSSFFCSSSPRPPRQSSSPSVSPILFAKLLANPLRQLRIAVSTAGPQPPNRVPKYAKKYIVILVAAPWTSFGWAKGPQFHLGPTRFLRESLRGAYAKVRSEMDFLKTSHCHQSLLFCELISKQKEYSARTASGYNVKCLSINPLFL